jgi:hypothetical protein
MRLAVRSYASRLFADIDLIGARCLIYSSAVFPRLQKAASFCGCVIAVGDLG